MEEHKEIEERHVIRSVQNNFYNEENFKRGKNTQGLGSKPLI